MTSEATAPVTGVELSPDDRTSMAQEERAIARKYVGGVPWVMVAWGLGNFVLWLSLWPLVFMGTIPLWLGSIISILSIMADFERQMILERQMEGIRIAQANKTKGACRTVFGYG